ncbi:MAG: replication initiator protein [Microviridae sp.]|nr:MAG: replication initiator protein [Microviridae sp.]
MCLYPRLIKNPKYKSNKKNGGNIPQLKDDRVKMVPIGCGNCLECRKQKAREWQIRLLEDIKTNKNGKFITLTYTNKSIKELINQKPTKNWPSMQGLEGYDLDNEIATRSVRLFLERWRKKYKKSLRHWLVTEIGHNGTENIHLHGIIWTNENSKTISEIWQYGYVWAGKEHLGNIINYVNEKTINYITKYINKIDEKHKHYKSKILTSPGIGNNYTKTTNSKSNKYNHKKTNETYRTNTGHKISLPIYWRNKIYTEQEREQLWLQKLDKEERWIRGEKIKINQGTEQYFNILKWHQKLNEEIGYGTDQINWQKKQYEQQIRITKQKERINKTWKNIK